MRRTACAEETWLQDVGWSTAKELKGEDTMKERMQRKTEKYSRAGRGRYNPESHYRESKALSFPFHGRDGGGGWRLAGSRAAAAETLEESERTKGQKKCNFQSKVKKIQEAQSWKKVKNVALSCQRDKKKTHQRRTKPENIRDRAGNCRQNRKWRTSETKDGANERQS